MHPKLIELGLDATASYILSCQQDSGAILWNPGDKLDPWDHVEAAMGLTVAGHFDASKRAFVWLAEHQSADGSWPNCFYGQQDTDSPADPLKETNFIAYCATGLWHYYQITGERAFLETHFLMIERAIDYVTAFQQPEGDIAWAVDSQNQPQADALLTACSSIARSIECALHSAKQLGKHKPSWVQAHDLLSDAIKNKPERFDRTWESKARFAMDWYYPILAGLYSPVDATARIHSRWDEFVEAELGCRCVNDEPWVTMAETAELCIALVAAGLHDKALALFDTLFQWRASDGGFVTGYVFRDNTIWPETKTTWTAGAVLLAADALFELTPAHRLFTSPACIPTRA